VPESALALVSNRLKENALLRAALLIGLAIPTLVYAQPRSSSVPPLPGQERFVPRGGLSVTLQVSPNRVQIDQVPTFTVVVRNVGTRRVLVLPDVASNIRIFDRDGRFVPARHGALVEYAVRLIQARDLIPLEPGATHAFMVDAQYHSPYDYGAVGTYAPFSPGSNEVGLALSPGTYSVRFGYYALEDSGAMHYAEAMPAELWEGSIETAGVSLTVLPLEGSRLTKAIADIDGPAPAETLAELSQVARSPQIIDAWLRRFERNAAERRAVINAIAGMGDSAISRVLELVAALPERERQALITTSGPLIGLQAQGCLGVPWLLQTLNNSLDNLTGLESTYRTIGARCPELLKEIRAIVQSPVQVRNGASDAYARAKYLEVLGWIGDRSDVPLMLATLKGDAPATRPSANDAGTLRRGALRGLSRFGGEDTAQAILDRLRLVRNDRYAPTELLMIAGRLPLPEATPLLVDLLDSTNSEVVTFAIRALQERGDRDAVPALEGLLTRPNQHVRQTAAGALLSFGNRVSLPLMRSLVGDSDPAVRTMALDYLARHGDASDVPLFIEHLGTRTWEPTIRGIDRLGTAAAFLPLKSKLDATSDRETRSFLTRALQSLTFAPFWRDASEWDTWWSRHSTSTRVDWAREALADAGKAEPTHFASQALEFLSRTGDLTAQLLDAATVSRNARVRLTAARIIGQSDQRRAVLLLARELEHRSVSWCRQAVIEFNTLMARNEQLDCTNLGERASARTRWTALARE
jgi:HEAT repeat protein